MEGIQVRGAGGNVLREVVEVAGEIWDLWLLWGIALVARHRCCSVVWYVWLWLQNRVWWRFDFFRSEDLCVEDRTSLDSLAQHHSALPSTNF